MSGGDRDRWQELELRHFGALEAIARERSFRGAAGRLGCAQSAISRQVAFLEEVAGVRLVERSRGPGPVKLTENGELLLEHARDLLASAGAARSDLARAGDARGVRVGVLPGVPARILREVLEARTGLDVRAVAVRSDALLTGRVDLAFACLPVAGGPFETRELLRVPWVLAAPPGAARSPLIGPEERLRPLRGRVAFDVDAPEAALALAATGVGGAVVPELAVEDDPRFRVSRLGRLAPLPIGLAWHRDRRLPAAVTEFRDAAARLMH